MSACGYKRKSGQRRRMSAYTPTSDIRVAPFVASRYCTVTPAGRSLDSNSSTALTIRLPRRVAVQVALIEHGNRPHGGMGRRVGAVLFYEDLGGSVDVEVGGHG